MHTYGFSEPELRRERRRDRAEKGHERFRLRSEGRGRRDRQPGHRAAHRDRRSVQDAVRESKSV